MDSGQHFARIILKTMSVHGFDHRVNRAAKVRNVSRLGSQFLSALTSVPVSALGGPLYAPSPGDAVPFRPEADGRPARAYFTTSHSITTTGAARPEPRIWNRW